MQIRSYVLHERQEPLARRAQIHQRCFMFTHCSTFVLYDNAHTRNKTLRFFPDGAAKKCSLWDSINQPLMWSKISGVADQPGSWFQPETQADSIGIRSDASISVCIFLSALTNRHGLVPSVVPRSSRTQILAPEPHLICRQSR